jgi:ribonuclease HII
MHSPNFEEEKILCQQGFKCVVGLDEAGRGPLAGPVVAAAVLLKFDSEKLLKKINDSKKLSEKQRNYFYKVLTNHKNIKWGIGIVSEKIIDKINILEATKLAMQKAVKNLQKKMKSYVPVIIDGRRLSKGSDFLLLDGNFKIKSDIPQKSIIKGDQKVISISAASIIAKVTRDKIMEKFHKRYPKYGFDKHKGYPTKLHVKMIKKYGICKIHRKSFAPITGFLIQKNSGPFE